MAAAVDAARLVEMGLSKRELGLMGVARSTVSRLINDAVIPSRAATLIKIGAVLGWTPGSCEAVLAGSRPTLRGRPGSIAQSVVAVDC